MKKLLLITLMLFAPLTFADTCPDPSTLKFSKDKLTIKDTSWEVFDITYSYEYDEYMNDDYYDFDGAAKMMNFDLAFYDEFQDGLGISCVYGMIGNAAFSFYDPDEDEEVDGLASFFMGYTEIKTKALVKGNVKPSKSFVNGSCDESLTACSWKIFK